MESTDDYITVSNLVPLIFQKSFMKFSTKKLDSLIATFKILLDQKFEKIYGIFYRPFKIAFRIVFPPGFMCEKISLIGIVVRVSILLQEIAIWPICFFSMLSGGTYLNFSLSSVSIRI